MSMTDTLLEIEQSIQESDGLLTARHSEYQLFSLFQPIYSFAHKRMVGCEGLTRCIDPNGRLIPAGRLLGTARSIEDTIYLDRLMRALHVGNFSTRKRENAWLFLNVSPVVVINSRQHGSFFTDLLRKYDFPPHRVVIEIMETGIPDEDVLEHAVSHYRELGCMVAIDDFGAGHSNFERIWRLKPNIVKLDRVMIQRAAQEPEIRRSLGMIAGLIHEMAGLVLAEGIETEEQAVMAINADVDLVQGFLFSESFDLNSAPQSQNSQFNRIQELMIRHNLDEKDEFSRAVEDYIDAFNRCANMLAAGLNIQTATEEMSGYDRVLRFYLLNEFGTQIGENVTPEQRAVQRDSRLAPLLDGRGANWAHRPYFRRAMAHPDKVQLTRPYLSLTDACMCLTLTRVVQLKRECAVLCCDLEWHEAPTPSRLYDSDSVPDHRFDHN